VEWPHLINITNYNIPIQDFILVKVIVYIIFVYAHIDENTTISSTNFLLNLFDVTMSL